jgi:mono/diheme cytochrome c family protein
VTLTTRARRGFARQAGRRALCLVAAMMALAGVTLGAQPAAPAAPVTYSKDVAPIVFARCASCHHPGGPAPFSVLTYSAIRQHAQQIAGLTASRYMPPVKPEPGYGDFVGQRRLTDEELSTLQRWVAGGALEGDQRDLPPPPAIAVGWQLGTPDLVVKLPAYDLPASGTDQFRIFVVRVPNTAVKYVRGLEFQPGSTNIVHHANIRVDRTPNSRRLDEEDPRPGYEGLLAHSATYPDGHFLAWTPGQAAPFLPKGLAWRLDPGTDLVVELHLQPTGKLETIQPSIGLYFTTDPPQRTPGMLRLGRQSIDIAPGQRDYVLTDSFTVPVPISVLALQPHAHYRAREVSGTATLPDGSTKPLILIRDWDFRWQQVYRYVTPLRLPAGTTLSMRYVYDNSADNPRNVTQPPQRVIWGQRSGDEMGDLWIQVLTDTDRDLDRLLTAFRPKVIAEDIIGYEARISAEPDSVPLHDDVALLYLDEGNVRKAVEHFERSAVLRPTSAPAQFNLGTALAFGGALDAAIAAFQRALALSPDYALAHHNLGAVLLTRGDLAGAREHLLRSEQLDPGNPEVHLDVGRLYRKTGDPRACGEFQRALADRPGWADAERELAQCK